MRPILQAGLLLAAGMPCAHSGRKALRSLDAEGVEGIGGDAERSIFELHARQPFLVHRLDDDTGCDAQPLCGLGGEKHFLLVRCAPPSSRPNLPWSIRMTVASSS